MRYLLAFLLLTSLSLSASAQTIRVRNQLPPPTPIPGDPPPVPRDARPSNLVPPVVPAPGPSIRPMTLDEFAKHFRPEPGRANYEVILVHPCTGKAVKVCFDLPTCPKRIRWGKTEIVFRYGLCKKPVVVTFCRDGSIRVA